MIPTIYLHHDVYAMSGPHLPSVDQQHKREKYPRSAFGFYTFYQVFIERSGKRTQTRPYMDGDVVYKEAHRNSISVCLGGNLDIQNDTLAQALELKVFFREMIDNYNVGILNIKRHNSYQATSCPGRNIPTGYFQIIFICARYNLSDVILKQVLSYFGRKV